MAPEPGRIQRFYDWIGARYDWLEGHERAAKEQALALLDARPGQRVLNIGVGTGRLHRRVFGAIGLNGTALGFDLSPVMLRVTRERTGCPVVRGAAPDLPFATRSFDRVICSYVVDLLPEPAIRELLDEIGRVLTPDGRAVLVALTEGETTGSRIVTALWKALYRINPILLGGCRPVRIETLTGKSRLDLKERRSVTQLALTSEIAVAGPAPVREAARQPSDLPGDRSP